MAWVRAGTITVAANSATVTGTNTGWLTAGVRAGDAMYINGAAYEIKSVDSATQISLQTNVPTAVTNGAYQIMQNLAGGDRVAITTELANLLATRLREYQVMGDIANTIFGSDASSVSIVLPNGQSKTGAGWGYISSGLVNKMDKSQNLNDVANKATSRANLGLGGAATLDVGTTAGTVMAGNDSRIDGAYQKTGGIISGQIIATTKSAAYYKHPNGFDGAYNYHADIRNGDGTVVLQNALYLQSGQYWAERDILTQGGTAYVWEKRNDGSFRSPGTVYASGNALTSDRRLKSNFEPVDYDIDIIDKIIPQRYDKRSPEGDVPAPPAASEPFDPIEGEASEDPISSGPVPTTPTVSRELGIVAQDLQAVLPDLVSEYYWNEKYPDLLSINYSGLAAWLVGYVANLKDLVKAQGITISKQESIITAAEGRLTETEARMKAIDGLDA